jgi:hypothetical protein
MSLPVEVLQGHVPGAREALILALDEESAGEVRIDLALGDGGRAFASVNPFDLAWLEVRVGDIVWVRRAASGTPSAGPRSRARR